MTSHEIVIRPGDAPVTLINVFDVEGEHQQELVDLLRAGAEEVVRQRPGFLSAGALATATPHTYSVVAVVGT